MIAETAREASGTSSKMASRVTIDSAFGSSRTVAFVTIASVPSEPTITPAMSYPRWSPVLPPTSTTSPSAVTISRPRMWLTVAP